ncbi:MerR family transcriptional regulator [Labrys okinawensis]|uniref:MerR family transcriptional regulator n=1 Tax=Labrys okinawensis TaxID=346911 RepID=UPI0039BC21EA
MVRSAEFLNASEAARRLGVSTKALRLYEQHGLLVPVRSAAGWRAYGPGEMERAAEIAALRDLGFSLAQIGRVLKRETKGLGPALALHQAALEARLRQLTDTLARVRGLRDDLARSHVATTGEPAGALSSSRAPGIAFDLPWPWGGERFELSVIRPLTYIIGPLGSGKTRLAQRLAETSPGAAFLGLDRLTESGPERLAADPALKAPVDKKLAWLIEDGATASDALTALLCGLEAAGPTVLVVDMIEHGLDQATQEAVIAMLRCRGPAGRPLFLLTRSSAILDLAVLGPDEAIVFCPANHSPPMLVVPHLGAPGFEGVATCLASPAVRARTEGVIAWRPQVA